MKTMRGFSRLIGGLVGLAMICTAGSAQASIIAFDMVGSSSQNLNSFSNAFNGAFTSLADGFQKYQRGVSGSIPFSVLDDSLSIFPADSLGIIGETNTDEFFGVTDTVNGDNPGGAAFAEWKFDISGFNNLMVSIDAGAMGDFESTDTFVWSASIDGGAFVDVFVSSVDVNGSQVYTLDGGGMFLLNDPMLVNGLLLNNNLQTVSAALGGQGAELTLRLDATTNGGAEAFAFQNLVIEGDAIAQVPEPSTLALFVIALGGLGFMTRRRVA